LLEITILVLILCWIASFFDNSLFPGMPHATGFTDALSVVIVLLIMVHFLK
jgi:hypothetical protein